MKKLLLIALMLCGLARAQEVTVFFDFDSYKLTESAKAVLDSTLSNMKYYEGVRCDISGFTDDKGKPGYNDTLAIRRANAVKDYLLVKSPMHTFKLSATKMTEWPAGTTDAQKRCVKVVPQNMLECSVLPQYEQRTTSGNGVVIIGANFSGEDRPLPSVTTSFSAEEMLANGRFGIDKDGNILKSWGMIDINGGQSDDGYYTIMIPITEGTDPDMSIWVPDNDDAEVVKWKNTPIKIEKDKTRKYYVCRVPVSKSGRTSINLDKSVNYAGKGVKYKVIYVATDKPYNFYKVGIGHKNSKVSFSAKINDTLYAFAAPYKVLTRGMDFSGWENGEEKPLKFRLARCKFKQDKQNNIYYAMTDKTLKKPTQKETGLWAWLGRLFKNS